MSYAVKHTILDKNKRTARVLNMKSEHSLRFSPARLSKAKNWRSRIFVAVVDLCELLVGGSGRRTRLQQFQQGSVFFGGA